MKTEIKGGAPYDNGLSCRMQHAYNIVAGNPKLRVWIDIESGEPSVITKEQYDKFFEYWEVCKPIFIPELNVGRFFVFGTSGNSESKDFNSFEELWKKI